MDCGRSKICLLLGIIESNELNRPPLSGLSRGDFGLRAFWAIMLLAVDDAALAQVVKPAAASMAADPAVDPEAEFGVERMEPAVHGSGNPHAFRT